MENLISFSKGTMVVIHDRCPPPPPPIGGGGGLHTLCRQTNCGKGGGEMYCLHRCRLRLQMEEMRDKANVSIRLEQVVSVLFGKPLITQILRSRCTGHTP